MGPIRRRLRTFRSVLLHMHGEELTDRVLSLDEGPGDRDLRERLLVSLSPRVLSDSSIVILDLPETIEVAAVDPALEAHGQYDVALVDAGIVVDATVRIELLEDGTCIVTRAEGEDIVLQLRHAVDLAALVGSHLDVERTGRVGGDVEGDARTAVRCRPDSEGATR